MLQVARGKQVGDMVGENKAKIWLMAPQQLTGKFPAGATRNKQGGCKDDAASEAAAHVRGPRMKSCHDQRKSVSSCSQQEQGCRVHLNTDFPTLRSMIFMIVTEF